MKFNLISNLDENAIIKKLWSYNHVIAWQLRIALNKAGHTAILVSDRSNNKLPSADHTIVISNIAMNRVRSEPEYREALRKKTDGKLCLWLDSDLGEWEAFDKVLCVNLCHGRNSQKFIWVGWATDPLRFYPRQTKQAVFVDPYMYGWYNGECDFIYDSIGNVLGYSKITVFQPVETYNHGRVPWMMIAQQLSQCSYFIATQIANWGLVNLEAATAGALVIIHEKLDRPETWPSKLNYVTWKTREDLVNILKQPVDITENRKVALENSWSKVVNRIMEELT